MGVSQTQGELLEHLEDQLRFLESSAEAFDKGFDGESKRMALAMRVLCYDSNASRSLLGQLGKKAELFVDTSEEIDPENLAGHNGLVRMAVGPGVPDYVAPLDNLATPAKRVPFDEWWTATVIIDSKGQRFSREDLVRAVADQDGGAHVDPKLNAKYASLSRQNSMGWTTHTPAGSRPTQSPHRAAVRQIAHELLKTFRVGYQKLPALPRNVTLFGNISLKPATPEEIRSSKAARARRASVRGRVPSRNAPCPCGSGKRFKNCCLSTA